MAHFRSGLRNPDGTWTYSLQSCIEQFSEAFPMTLLLVTSHCICKGKSTGRPKLLTEEVVADIENRMKQSPTKAVSHLSAQTGLSIGTCHKALKKNLHMHAYKVLVVQQLQSMDHEKRVQFCHWFNQNLKYNNLLNLTLFNDEAWFHLSGYVNSQNYRTWGLENPDNFVETNLHPIKSVYG